jgi:basic membrane lipoprotein Med (substrate-binding protein (PBP1-ABC) superfamily)
MAAGTARRKRTWLTVSLVVAAMAVTAGCGTQGTQGTASAASSGSGSKGSGSKPAKHLKVAWLLYGPRDDGGWNVANISQSFPAVAKLPSITQQVADNVPFTQQAGELAQSYIQGGANVVIDTAGFGTIFTNVCAQNLSVKCFEVVPLTKLTPNTSGYWAPSQLPEYAAGVAAGLMTKTNVVGYIIGFNSPYIIGGVDSFALGCQKVDPKCVVRVVNINSFFDPSATVQAANSLIDAGADVVRGWVDDPSFCSAAESKRVYAIGDFGDAYAQCPKAVITSTVWNFSSYFQSQIKAIQNGTWKESQLTFVPAKQVFSLGKWGSFVPASVRNKVTSVFNGLISGTLNPFVGPITDNQGRLRIPAGTKLSAKFLYNGWGWYVKGVVASS